MGAYILRRILLMIPTILGIMAISFAVIQFAPGGQIGTSNEALGGPISLLTSDPVMLLALPVSELDSLLDALELSPTWSE